MRPPTDAAIQKAISILIQSVEEENAVTEREYGNPQTQVFRAVQVVQTASEAVRRAVDAECSKWRRCLNTFAAIHTLPLEVFVKILAEDISHHSIWRHIKQTNSHAPTLRQHDLAQVCSYWRDTILSEPQCWTEVRFGGEHTELLLRRSKSAPLNIVGESRTRNAVEYLAFLHLVGPEAHRWKHASITGQDEASRQAVDFYLRNASSLSLVDLALNFSPRSAFPPAPTFTRIRVLDVAPIATLRRINFRGVAPPWDTWRLGNLRTLELEGVRDGPTEADLHAVLLASPELQRLALESVSSRLARGGEGVTLGPVPLPHLSTLILLHVPDEIVDYAIRNLRPAALHVLRSYQLRAHHLCAESTPCLAPALNSYAELTLVNDCIDKIVYIDAGDDEVPHGEDAPLQLYWENQPTAIEPLAKWLASCIGPHTQVNIEVNGTWEELNLGDQDTRYFPISVLEILSPHIRSVNVRHHGDAVDVLECLSKPRFDDNRQRYWLCPNLTHLSLDQTRGLTEEDIETFMTNRWGDERGADGEGRPVPLEEFVSPNYTDFEDTDEDEY